MATFKAIVIEKSEAGQKVGLTDFDDHNLMAGDVTVSVDGRRSTTRTGWRSLERLRSCAAFR